MASVRRDAVGELAALVRVAERGGTTLAPFVLEHATELADAFASCESELRACVNEPDEAVADRLMLRLEAALARRRRAAHDHRARRIARAARDLERGARLCADGVRVDPGLVLGDLLADPRTEEIAFTMTASVVLVATARLRRGRWLRRTFSDLRCFVNDTGIHFRWGLHGRLNLKPERTTERTLARAVIVDLAACETIAHVAM